VESARIPFRRLGAWLLDHFHWWVTGYGVELWRVLVAITLILVIGTLIFHGDGAVEPRNSLKWLEAFSVSLRVFLPIEVPAGSRKPSSETLWKIRFTSFATLLKLLGWVLVPLLVAGLSGWLKR